MNILNFITLDNNIDNFLPDNGESGEQIIVPFMSFHSNRLIEQALPSHQIPLVVARRQLDSDMMSGDVAMTDAVNGVVVFCVSIASHAVTEAVTRAASVLQVLAPEEEFIVAKECEDVPGSAPFIEALSQDVRLNVMSWGEIKNAMVNLKENGCGNG